MRVTSPLFNPWRLARPPCGVDQPYRSLEGQPEPCTTIGRHVGFAAMGDNIRHGTLRAYNRQGCRCQRCRAFYRDYRADYRRARRGRGQRKDDVRPGGAVGQSPPAVLRRALAALRREGMTFAEAWPRAQRAALAEESAWDAKLWRIAWGEAEGTRSEWRAAFNRSGQPPPGVDALVGALDVELVEVDHEPRAALPAVLVA
jgi:hypothetical protein